MPQIIEIFTHLLFEENVLIVAEDVENLLPVMFAIKSFLYPLRLGVFVPHLHDDGNEGYSNNLSSVTAPFVYFFGIDTRSQSMAQEFIEEDDRVGPLVVELRERKRQRNPVNHEQKISASNIK